MKASRDSLVKAFRMHGCWITALLLCQCTLPQRQAWQYIRTNGLLTYWNNPSPPFGVGTGYSQRYVARGGSSYTAPRYSQRPASYWSSYADSGTSHRIPYRSTPRSGYSSRYFATPSQPSSSAPVPAPRHTPRARPESPAPRPAPRIPVEEPPEAPAIVRNEPPPAPSTTPQPPSLPKSNGAPPAAPASTADLPYGTPVPGRPNMVNSPFAAKTQLVDVSGMGVGQPVKCPYTGKLFKVPPPQQAANTVEPRLESKIDSPKMSSEPKDGNKKP